MLALEGRITLLEYTLLRNLAIVAIAISIAFVKGVDFARALPSDKTLVMLGRALGGFSVSLLVNESLELIPFSLLVILFQTNPFWTAALSHCFNGEKVKLFEVFGMLICFAGVIVIANNDESPVENLEMLDSETGEIAPPLEEEEQVVKNASITARTCGIVLIMTASIISAWTAVFNRALKSVDYTVVMTYHGMLGFFASLMFLSVQFIVEETDSDSEPAKLKTLDLSW